MDQQDSPIDQTAAVATGPFPWKRVAPLLILVFLFGVCVGVWVYSRSVLSPGRSGAPVPRPSPAVEPQPSQTGPQPTRGGVIPTADPSADELLSVTVRVVDALTQQAVPKVELTFTISVNCIMMVGAVCPTVAPAVHYTDAAGIQTFPDLPGDWVVAEKEGYYPSDQVEMLAYPLESVGMRDITIELYPLTAQVHDQESAYAAARRTTIVKQWLAAHPGAGNDGARREGAVWRVQFIAGKSACDTYQPANPDCAVWVELDSATGSLIRSGP